MQWCRISSHQQYDDLKPGDSIDPGAKATSPASGSLNHSRIFAWPLLRRGHEVINLDI